MWGSDEADAINHQHLHAVGAHVQPHGIDANHRAPYVIKQIEQGRLHCRKVGRHRRVEFQELLRFQQQQQQRSEEALQGLSDLSQELGLGLGLGY